MPRATKTFDAAVCQSGTISLKKYEINENKVALKSFENLLKNMKIKHNLFATITAN